MFTSNAKINLINYGDMFRIQKYFKVFSTWDTAKVKTVYPEQLSQEVSQINFRTKQSSRQCYS